MYKAAPALTPHRFWAEGIALPLLHVSCEEAGIAERCGVGMTCGKQGCPACRSFSTYNQQRLSVTTQISTYLQSIITLA